MSEPTLIYDGECAFCRRSIAWFQARDPDRRLAYLPRQSPERATRYPQLDDARYQGAMQCIGPEGTIHSGANAIATALRHLHGRGWRCLGHVMQWPGVRFGAHLAYRWIAKNRYRFHCHDTACRRPD